MIILSITDIKKFWIPNFIVLPAIALGIYLTGNWLWALIIFLFGSSLFGYRNICPACGHVEEYITRLSQWRGGDVKLLVMTGAFMGIFSLPIFLLSKLLLLGYRKVKSYDLPLPYTPFVFFSSVIVIGTIIFTKQFVDIPPLITGGL